MAGRYVEIQLVTNNIYWGTSTTNWPGYVQSGGFTPSHTPRHDVERGRGGAVRVCRANDETQCRGAAHRAGKLRIPGRYLPSPLGLAASDLSYYLGELTGLPHPIISPAQSNQYPGTLYVLTDLSSLAPNYNTTSPNAPIHRPTSCRRKQRDIGQLFPWELKELKTKSASIRNRSLNPCWISRCKETKGVMRSNPELFGAES